SGMISVNVDGDDILVARIGDDFYATDGWCTHAAGMLHEGYLHADTCEVECPIHEGYFDLRSGEATNPPAEEPVVAYDVRVEGDDILVGPKG
ncbi:MAG: non-heme iron oxygenase ferredoxin subunit, partial [Dehalococcoidia bacterium]